MVEGKKVQGLSMATLRELITGEVVKLARLRANTAGKLHLKVDYETRAEAFGLFDASEVFLAGPNARSIGLGVVAFRCPEDRTDTGAVWASIDEPEDCDVPAHVLIFQPVGMEAPE